MKCLRPANRDRPVPNPRALDHRDQGHVFCLPYTTSRKRGRSPRPLGRAQGCASFRDAQPWMADSELC